MGENINYYDGSTLLKKKTLSGDLPEIFISQTLRTYGKTTWFNHLVMDHWHESDKRVPFGLLFRYKYELEGVAMRFQESVRELYYPGLEMTQTPIMQGSIMELFANDELCGYAFCLSGFEAVKKCSNMLSSIREYIFDEFQNEDGKYIKNEVNKFISIHTSIARAPGKPVRYVPVYMLANKVSLFNPYYTAMGITGRFQKRTKYLRGDGYVMESLSNVDLSQRMQNSGFNKAFASEDYMRYITDVDFLNEGEADDILKLAGEKRYFCNLSDGSKLCYGVYRSGPLTYISAKGNPTSKQNIGLSKRAHFQLGSGVINRTEFLRFLREQYNEGSLFFQNDKVKTNVINCLTES